MRPSFDQDRIARACVSARTLGILATRSHSTRPISRPGRIVRVKHATHAVRALDRRAPACRRHRDRTRAPHSISSRT